MPVDRWRPRKIVADRLVEVLPTTTRTDPALDACRTSA
jgi:hypothetical protein